MLYPDLVDIPIEIFGGYCPAVAPSDLSPGAASIAQDVMYPMAGMRTRGGLLNVFGLGAIIATGATANVNGLKTFITPSIQQRLLAWDAAGNFYKENPQGTMNLVASRPYQNLFYQSQTLFGREYQAFFNSLGGFDIPRQFDDTNWDRVSQVGPGASPFVSDETLALTAIVASPNGLFTDPTRNVQSAVEVGNLVTMSYAAAAGDNNDLKKALNNAMAAKVLQVQVAGVGAGYNGTFPVVSLDTTALILTYVAPVSGLGALGVGGTLSFSVIKIQLNGATWPFTQADIGQAKVTIAGATDATYDVTGLVLGNILAQPQFFWISNPLFGTAASGGGTISVAANITAGLRQVSCAFITRQGFITPAAPPNNWTAAGGKRAVLANLPIGPANVTARLLMFTPVITAPATTGNFFSLPNGSSQVGRAMMLINDNVSTSAIVDFTDTILGAGFSCNYLFTQLELGESAFFLGYNSRLCWLGERAKVPNFQNLTFDGGFSLDGSGRTYPNYWTQGSGNYAGGGSAVAQGFTADWGDAYAITGDGATATRGFIQQSAYVDYLGVSILQSNTSYSVRFRAAKAGGLAQGKLHVTLTNGGEVTVTAAQLTASYQEFSGILTTPIIPAINNVLEVFADGTPTNGGVFLIDSIEIYPTNSPFNYSTARFSHAFNPESYDGTTGQIQVRPNDGQQLRGAFPLRNNLYLAKDHYLCYVTDDGINEPAAWAVNEVSASVGICGPNAVDWTEEWAVFAERSGLYLCWGGDPVDINQELQGDASGTGKINWQSINWQYGHTVWVRIDKVNKMILVGAPVNGATTPNVVFMMDYRWLDSPQEIADSPMMAYSTFTGKAVTHGKGRRWSLWSITANSMAFAERIDGTTQPFFGNGVGNGKIYQQLDCAMQGSDDGVAIPWTYQSYMCPSHMEEQALQLGAHRKLFGYLKFRALGSGLFPMAITTAQRATLLRSYTLSTNPIGDGERPLNLHGERAAFTIRTNTVAGSWFQMEKLILCVKKDPTIVTRGMSS